MNMLQPYLEKLEPHLDEFRQRYQQLQPREQQMLKALCVLLPCFLFVFAYCQPLQQRIAQLQKHEVQLEKDVAEARLLATHLQQSTSKKGKVQGNFMAQVEQLAKKSAVRSHIVHLKPQTAMDGHQRLNIRFQDVPYAAMMTFFHVLADAGFQLDRVRLDRVDKHGYLNANVWVMQP